MRVKTAARQLSHTVTAAIHSFSVSNIDGLFPVESIQTAEFAQLIDDLFDSLNGSTINPDDGKRYRCCLQDGSPHSELYSKLLSEMTKWKLFDLTTEKDVTNQYYFVKGWMITIRSVIYLWHQLKALGFTFLNMRNLNQDPLENLFCQIRQHGIANSNPTCYQFVAALKTVILNNLVTPISNSANCESDNCENLNNFRKFLSDACNSIHENKSELFNENENELMNEENNSVCTLPWIDFENININTSQALSYVSGYLVKKLQLPDENCSKCQTDLFCIQQEQHHLYTSFKEYSEKDSLIYPSNKVTMLIQNLHNRLFHFCDENGHKANLESVFKKIFFNNYSSDFCTTHRCDNMIVENSLSFLIHKYVKDKKKPLQMTSGHYEKTKQFKSL